MLGRVQQIKASNRAHTSSLSRHNTQSYAGPFRCRVVQHAHTTPTVQKAGVHDHISFHQRVKYKRPRYVALSKEIFRRDGRKIEYAGIAKAEFDYFPDGYEEELMPHSSSWVTRPQWFRSGLEWVADPLFGKYPKRMISVFRLDGKKPPGMFKKIWHIIKIPLKQVTRTGLFFENLLEWSRNYFQNWKRLPTVVEATQSGTGSPLEEQINKSQHRMRILFREDYKEFWRIYPPLEHWQAPYGRAEPDPHMDPNPSNAIPVLTDSWMLGGSYAEDRLMTLYRLSNSRVRGAVAEAFARVFGSSLQKEYYNILHEARERREKERKEMRQAGSIHHPMMQTLRAVMPGWNHANAFEYGRRNPYIRVVQEDTDLMARIPEREMVAMPRSIQLLYSFRSVYDEVFGPMGTIPRSKELELALAFNEQQEISQLLQHVPARFRRVTNVPQEPRPFFYNVDPVTAYKDEMRLYQTFEEQATLSRMRIDSWVENVGDIMKSNPMVEALFTGEDNKRIPVGMDEFGRAIQRRRYEYPKWKEVLADGTRDLRYRLWMYWSPQTNTIYSYAWKTLSLVKDIPMLFIKGTVFKEIKSAVDIMRHTSYIHYHEAKKAKKEQREHRLAYLAEYLRSFGSVEVPKSARPYASPSSLREGQHNSDGNVSTHSSRTTKHTQDPREDAGTTGQKRSYHTSRRVRSDLDVDRVPRKRADPSRRWGDRLDTDLNSKVIVHDQDFVKEAVDIHVQELASEMSAFINNLEEKKLDPFLPPHIKQIADTIHKDELLAIKRAAYQLEKERQFEKYMEQKYGKWAQLLPRQFLLEWRSFEPTPPGQAYSQTTSNTSHPDVDTSEVVHFSKKLGDSKNASANDAQPPQNDEDVYYYTELGPVPPETVEEPLPTTLRGLFDVLRRQRQLEYAQSLLEKWKIDRDRIYDKNESLEGIAERVVERINSDYRPSEKMFQAAEEEARKLGKPIPSRNQEHFVAHHKRVETPVSRLWLEAEMREVYARRGILEPTVDIESYVPVWVKSKADWEMFDSAKRKARAEGLDWWNTGLLTADDIYVLVELKRRKMIEYYRARDIPVPEKLKTSEFIRKMSLQEAVAALKSNGFSYGPGFGPGPGAGPAPHHPVVVSPDERLPTNQRMFITQVSQIWYRIAYRVKQIFESRLPPPGIFEKKPLEFKWEDVPEDVLVKYKVLLQWDNLAPTDLPLEYYEFCWMIKQEKFGFPPIPPKRYEEIVVEQYPELCLPYEFDNYKDLKKRREAAEADPYRFCIVGQEPPIPEIEEEKKRKREELQRIFREQVVTEIDAEEPDLSEEERNKKIDEMVKKRLELTLEAERLMQKEEQELRDLQKKLKKMEGQKTAAELFDEGLKEAEKAIALAKEEASGFLAGLEGEEKLTDEERLKRMQDKEFYKEQLQRKKEYKPSVIRTLFSLTSVTSTKWRDTVTKVPGWEQFELNKWIITCSMLVQLTTLHVLNQEFNHDRLYAHQDVLISWLQYWHTIRTAMKEGWLVSIEPIRIVRLPQFVNLETRNGMPFGTFRWTTEVKMTYWSNWDQYCNYMKGLPPQIGRVPGDITRPMFPWAPFARHRHNVSPYKFRIEPDDFERVQKQYYPSGSQKHPLDAMPKENFMEELGHEPKEPVALKAQWKLIQIPMGCVMTMDPQQDLLFYLVAWDMDLSVLTRPKGNMPNSREREQMRKEQEMLRRRKFDFGRGSTWGRIFGKFLYDPQEAAAMWSEKLRSFAQNRALRSLEKKWRKKAQEERQKEK